MNRKKFFSTVSIFSAGLMLGGKKVAGGLAGNKIPFQSGGSVLSPKIHFNRKVIDDVCAWPKIVRRADGKIFSAIFNLPQHGAADRGNVEVWASDDDGAHWVRQGTPTASSDKVARYNHALGIAHNGDLLVLSSGWSKDQTESINFYQHKKQTLLNTLCYRSVDDGRTWRTYGEFPVGPDGIHLIPFGNIEYGKDGALRVAAFSFRLPTEDKTRIDTCFCVKSEDDGRTWKIDAIIGNHVQNETDITHLGNGKWLAACRVLRPFAERKGHSIELFVSEDDGKMWRSLGPVTEASEHPGDLLVLKDGRIVLSYGNRNAGQFGVYAKISNDQGVSWSKPFKLADTLVGDSGYPGTVELEDGRLLTVYYAKGTPDFPDRYQMGAVQWSI